MDLHHSYKKKRVIILVQIKQQNKIPRNLTRLFYIVEMFKRLINLDFILSEKNNNKKKHT